MNNKHNTRILLGAIAALGLSAPSAFAVAYNLTPSGTATAQDWNTAATWGGGGTPGAGAGDTATLSVNFNTVPQTVNISAALTSGLTAVTLGDTNASPVATTVSASNGVSLFLAAGTIFSNGTAGAVNTISAPILNTTGAQITFGTSTNPLLVTGKITPAGSGNWTIENASSKQVTLGAIDLSAGATASTLTIRTGASIPNSTLVLDGTIANGSSVASNLTLGTRAGSNILQINGTNTYTGNTIVGIQANTLAYFKINSDQPFGAANTGNIQYGGGASGTAVQYFEAIGGDRAITKDVTSITRNIGFNGLNNITIAGALINGSNNSNIVNDIVEQGKVATIGQSGGLFNVSNSNADLTRTKTILGAGTTVIASNVNDSPVAGLSANSRMYFIQSGTGKLVFTGNNAAQGATRITTTGTVQIGNGGSTGAIAPTNGVAAIVNGTGTGGTLAFKRSDATSQAVVANGSIGIAQLGAGAVTLSNSQFNSGANQIGDGVSASKLVVSGSVVNSSATSTNATVLSTSPINTVTLNGSDTVSGLNLKVGQPVWLSSGAANTLAYIDKFTDDKIFTVSGGTLLTAGSQALSFGAGSALGTSAATTTVNNFSTLAGAGVISGSVSVLSGGHLAPGVNTVDADSSGRGNFGVAATLSTGALTLTGAKLDFDLAATAAGVSDFVSSTGAVSFDSFSFTFSALTTGVLEVGAFYNLLGGVGGFTGDTGQIGTAFTSDLAGQYAPAYSINANVLQVVFTAVPEPSSYGVVAGMLALGGGLLRRRRQSRS